MPCIDAALRLAFVTPAGLADIGQGDRTLLRSKSVPRNYVALNTHFPALSAQPTRLGSRRGVALHRLCVRFFPCQSSGRERWRGSFARFDHNSRRSHGRRRRPERPDRPRWLYSLRRNDLGTGPSRFERSLRRRDPHPRPRPFSWLIVGSACLVRRARRRAPATVRPTRSLLLRLHEATIQRRMVAPSAAGRANLIMAAQPSYLRRSRPGHKAPTWSSSNAARRSSN
jgi:hypothetical protein